MKNKLQFDFSGEKLDNFTEQQLKSGYRRESTPTIVVCPPMEDPTVSSGSRGRERSSRSRTRQAVDGNSLKSSSSNDSMTGEIRSDDNSCSASDTSSDGSERPRRHRSSVSLRRLFETLSLMTRSQSSSPSDRSRQSKKSAQPKRLLRPPVTYTYVRGMSGLPTQRVPRHIAYQYVT